MGLSLCLMFEFGVAVGLVSLAWVVVGVDQWPWGLSLGLRLPWVWVWWRFVNLIYEVCEFDGGWLFLLQSI